MFLKRLYIIIVFSACALTSAAQSSLTFLPSEWDFGTIREADGRVSHTFTGTNTSAKPLVILEVISSCGCTVPEYSRKPILPGEEVRIKVTYDPANRPGTFIKDLGIFDSQRRKVATLTIRGNVTAREKSIGELYPVEVASGLRITQSLSAFSYLYHGRESSSAIGLVNTSPRPLQLELRSGEQSGFLSLDYPHQIPAGAKGEIRLSYLIPEQAAHYGTVKDLITLRINGRDASVKLMAHGIAVDNPNLSNEIYAPKAEIDKYILKFGVLKRAAGLQRLPVRITNNGDGTLIIRAVEADQGVGTLLRAGATIEPGRTATEYVTVDPKALEYGALSGHLTLITNDPSKPMLRVRITAIIEE